MSIKGGGGRESVDTTDDWTGSFDIADNWTGLLGVNGAPAPS